MRRPYYTHDNMGPEFEVLGRFSGETLPPGIYRTRQVGQLGVSWRRIDAEDRVSVALPPWSVLAFLFRKLFYSAFPCYRRVELRRFTWDAADRAIKACANKPERERWTVAREDDCNVDLETVWLERSERITD